MVQIILLFLLSFLIRLAKIQDYLFFGFEQGRDLQIIQKIYQLRDFVLVGPSTSIGGVFHGVWYYYLLAIPLGLTTGNPLAASIFLIILSSFLPLVMYFLARNIFNSKNWGLITGLISIFSYEYILYARWLSNVSPAPLFIALAFLAIWKYSKTNSGKYFTFFVLFSLLATLFQMILGVQFLLLLILLLILKQIKFPKLKTCSFSLIIALVLLTPMLIFNFRNQNIILTSLINFIFKSGSDESGNFLGLISLYILQMKSHLQLSLVNIPSDPLQIIILTLIIFGGILTWKKYKKILIFLASLLLMSLPVVFISPGNPQYYVGVGIGWILLFTFTLKTFWESKKLKSLAVLLAILFCSGIFVSLTNLFLNKEVFFRTIQDDLNYKDQKRVLDFIHNDSQNQPYRLVSFTIPSLQPEAWDYLKQYFYPNDEQGGARVIYIVIEKYVYPVWENKWIEDLGPTDLLFEKEFGLLRLQKRQLKEAN